MDGRIIFVTFKRFIVPEEPSSPDHTSALLPASNANDFKIKPATVLRNIGPRMAAVGSRKPAQTERGQRAGTKKFFYTRVTNIYPLNVPFPPLFTETRSEAHAHGVTEVERCCGARLGTTAGDWLRQLLRSTSGCDAPLFSGELP